MPKAWTTSADGKLTFLDDVRRLMGVYFARQSSFIECSYLPTLDLDFMLAKFRCPKPRDTLARNALSKLTEPVASTGSHRGRGTSLLEKGALRGPAPTAALGRGCESASWRRRRTLSSRVRPWLRPIQVGGFVRPIRCGRPSEAHGGLVAGLEARGLSRSAAGLPAPWPRLRLMRFDHE
jgi:hypothetical protein